MDFNLAWSVVELERDYLDGCVSVVHYCISVQSSAEIFTSTSTVFLPRPERLIPFDELTESLVLSWVKEKLGDEKVSALEQCVIDKLTKKLDKTVVTGLPWSR